MTDRSLACPHCQADLAHETQLVGGSVYCPHCGARLDIVTQDDAADEWWVLGEDHREYGPATKPVLDRWLAEGRISAACQLRRGRHGSYVPASSVYPSLAHTAPPVAAPTRSPAPNGQRSWAGTLLLAFIGLFTGICGLHRFYLGHIAIGVLQLLTLGGCFIWQLIDIILIVSGSIRDAEGRPLY